MPELLKRMSVDVTADSRPAVVWVYRPDDDRVNTNCEANIFNNEGVGIAMKKFRTLRVNWHDIPTETLQEEYKRTPAFFFFDPTGKLVTKSQGKKVDSLSTFSKALDTTWRKSFNGKLRDYQKKMTKILDRLDRVDGRQQVLEQSRARLAAKPNPRKQRALDKEDAELGKQLEAIQKDEQKLLASVVVRPEHLPAEDGEEVARNR
ncbi:MAG: hypothetical protein ABFS86_16265 [Planctomycetota bacterium]